MKITWPFQDMTFEKWQNLGISSLIVFYVIQVVLDVFWRNTFGNLGIDFASYWSAGYIANHYGYARIYDLDLMRQVQFPLFPRGANPAFIQVLPTPYLAVFILPFQLLSLVQPISASWIWFALNLFIFVLYLHYFTYQITGQPLTRRLLAMIMVSSPVFLNLFNGQVNVWLTICVGEFLRAVISGKPFRSGSWLGGLLLKPQCLILVVPALLFQRSYKVVAGLAVSAAVIIGASILLGGVPAIYQLGNMWLGFAGGLPSSDPQLMMNWRMIGAFVDAMTASGFGWYIAISGLVITCLGTLYLWRRPLEPDSPIFAVSIAGTLAATVVVAWHSHVHMEMILIPPLVILHLKQKDLFRNKLEWWIFLPAGFYVLSLVLAAIMRAGNLPDETFGLPSFLRGSGIFGLNLYLLGWALHQSRFVPTNSSMQSSLKPR